MPMTVSLGKHWDKFVADRLKSGVYNNRSEVVRAGLKLLEAEEELIHRARKLTIELEHSLAAARSKLPNQAPPAKQTNKPTPAKK
jgi:putative addiction module CopG family antidote